MARLLFIDTETGGLDPEKHSLLSVGFVVWDSALGECCSAEYHLKNENYCITKTAQKINKLTDSDFYIQIGEVSSDVVEYQLKLDIELQIFGLKEERLTANPSPAASERKYEESGDESEDLTAEENNTDALQILDDCFEDLFEDEETGYTTCRLIVAKAGDTYGSIAQRYGVDEKQLRERNQEKEVNAKMLVMLP